MGVGETGETVGTRDSAVGEQEQMGTVPSTARSPRERILSKRFIKISSQLD
ncbi:MAG: hypothetical protein MUP21_03490 [Dehalococcoidia bacterium]|nr:hypothetical protein [Dehalococcoidia bacterium]